MRPETGAQPTYDETHSRTVCRPDLLADGPAREVARLLAVDTHIGDDRVEGLVLAMEAYDLATARVLWCRDCQTEAHAQGDALQWHEQEQHHAYVAMLATLRQSTGSEYLAGVEQAS
jgi:hypothetical protein